MTALVRAELLKLRTLRSTAWAAASLLVITVLTSTLALGEAGEKGYRTPAELRETVIAIGYTAVFFMVVLGAVAAAGEYRHRTVSQRFLISPARGRVLGAKLAAYGLAGAITTLVVTVLGAGLAELVVSSKGYTLDLGDAGLRLAAGAALAGGLAGMLGVVAGFLTRNPTTAMVAIFGTWIGEKIVGGWLGAGGRFLPYQLVENVLGLPAALSFGAAAAALAAVTAALALVAQRVVLPRDVT
jgi:ABC-2 type transport system permease protein